MCTSAKKTVLGGIFNKLFSMAFFKLDFAKTPTSDALPLDPTSIYLKQY